MMLTYCKACKGTGLYVGVAEKEGAAVVCRNCDGSGSMEVDITPPPAFKGRRIRDGVKTVSQANNGYYLKPGVDLGAVSYDDFLAGKLPSEFQLAPEYAE